MKKLLKSVSALLMIVMLLFASSVAVGAADDSLEIDGRISYNVGDTVSYTVYLADTTETVTGMELYIKYDPEYLQVAADSVDTPKLSNSVINAGYTDNLIYMNWLNVTKGVKFQSKAVLITADFKVLKAGSTNIEFWVEEMFSNDLTYLKTYTMTVEYSDNGKVIKDDVPPIIPSDPDFMSDKQGQFINYADGKGQQNTDVGDDHVAATGAVQNNNNVNNGNNNNAAANNNNSAATAATDGNGNVVVTNPQGEVQPTDSKGNYLDDDGKVLSTDDKGNYVKENGEIYQAAAGEDNGVDIGPIIIVVAIIVIAIAIVVIIVLKNRSAKNESGGNDNGDADGNGDTDDNNDDDKMI